MIETGIKGKQTVTADASNSAKTMGSGSLDVFATPAMVALMEKTAVKSLEEVLEEGQTTVGIALDIKHSAATPYSGISTSTSTRVMSQRSSEPAEAVNQLCCVVSTFWKP